MAVIFFRNIRNLILSRGIRDSATTVNTFAFTIFSGVQPTASTVAGNWTNYNTTFLAHWQGGVVSQANANTSGVSQTLTLSTIPGAVTANASGTASWAIMWPTNPSQATISGSSLPNTSFIILPVSDIAGNGMLKLTSTTVVQGNSYTIAELNIIALGGSN